MQGDETARGHDLVVHELPVEGDDAGGAVRGYLPGTFHRDRRAQLGHEGRQAPPERPVRRQLARHVDGRFQLPGLGLGVAPRGHRLHPVAVLGLRPVPVAQEQAGDAVVVAVQEHAARLPRVAVDRAQGLAGGGSGGAVRLPLPRGEILLRVDVDQVGDFLAHDGVEQQRALQVLAHHRHGADLPRPAGPDREAPALLGQGIADGARADACGVEGVDVHQPPGRLRPADGFQPLGDAGGEKGIVVGDVRNEGLQAPELARCRADPRHLEEGPLRVAQIEALPVPLQVVDGVAPQGAGIPPVLLPDVQVLRPVHGAMADGQQQAQDGRVLTGDLAVDPGDVRRLPEEGEEGDLIGGAVEPGHPDPGLVEKIETRCHSGWTSLSPVVGEYSSVVPASRARPPSRRRNNWLRS